MKKIALVIIFIFLFIVNVSPVMASSYENSQKYKETEAYKKAACEIDSNSSDCAKYTLLLEKIKERYKALNGEVKLYSYENDPEYTDAVKNVNLYCNSEYPDVSKCNTWKEKKELVMARYNEEYGKKEDFMDTSTEKTQTEGESGKTLSDDAVDVASDDDVFELCDKEEALKVFKAIGRVFVVVKIIVPFILIIIGSIDFVKVALGSKDEDIKKASINLAKKAGLGMLIFLIPTFISFIVDVLGGSNLYKSKFNKCTTCILTPSKCPK